MKCDQGRWRILLLDDDGSINELDQPFDDLAALCADRNRLVAIASSPLQEPGLLEFDVAALSWQHTPARDQILSKEEISIPEPFGLRDLAENRLMLGITPLLIGMANLHLCWSKVIAVQQGWLE